MIVMSQLHQTLQLVRMRRDLRVVLNAFAEYQIGFGNRMHMLKSTYWIQYKDNWV